MSLLKEKVLSDKILLRLTQGTGTEIVNRIFDSFFLLGFWGGSRLTSTEISKCKSRRT